MKLLLAFMMLAGLRLAWAGDGQPDAYKDAVLEDNPFAYYRLGETASTEPVADVTGDNPGQYVNAPAVGVPGAIATDSKNTAVSFTRDKEQYITLTGLGNFGSGMSAGFAVEYWLKTADSTDHQTIFQTANGPGFITIFLADIGYAGAAKRLRLYCRDDHMRRFEANFYVEENNIDIFDDHWHFIVHVYDPNAADPSDNVLLYVDGVRQALKVFHKGGGVPKFPDFENPISLGAIDQQGAVADCLEGSLDEVAFYLGPLTGAQVMKHYRAAAGPAKKE